MIAVGDILDNVDSLGVAMMEDGITIFCIVGVADFALLALPIPSISWRSFTASTINFNSKVDTFGDEFEEAKAVPTSVWMTQKDGV
jgi:hypothetical protein